MVMTDGDMNEIVQLEEAIQKLIPLCFQQQCGWHIIFKRWKKIAIWVQCFEKHTRKNFACIVMHWCYTFMYPGYCESVDELRILQALLHT